ncbi:MAG TPA: hypothetical protein VMV69_28980 [Pirellulales bacterium]|nr:hypothetical protein [Pirellulales bacterium]
MDKLHEIAGVASAVAVPRVETVSASSAKRVLSRTEKLAARIARVVRRRTSGSIVGLTVEVGRDGVHLGGRCATFYSKQLAQQAAMGVAEDETLTNGIEVA